MNRSPAKLRLPNYRFSNRFWANISPPRTIAQAAATPEEANRWAVWAASVQAQAPTTGRGSAPQSLRAAVWPSAPGTMPLEAIRYSPGSLQILDQLQLPEHCHYEALGSVQQARDAIRAMKVRGAPAIALVGCLSLAVELRAGAGGTELAALLAFVQDQLRLLVAARPTAVNMACAALDLAYVAAQEAEREGATVETVRERYGILDQTVQTEAADPLFPFYIYQEADVCRV